MISFKRKDNQEFILQNIDKARNYFLEEIKEDEFMSRKRKL